MSDAGRKIAYIKYDYNNNPVRIQFTNGCVTNYIYSATGEKLRVIYQTAVPNIEVAIGETRELTTNELVNKKEETVDYLLGGALTLKNGRIDKYQFEEGYCQAKRYNNTMDDFTFCYYDKDHLGDIRQVTEADGSKKGTIIQKMNYYPFGAEFCDASADSLVQPYKYNGKELDRMHGLNTYDYGARQHDPILGRWDRIDPLCETDYKTSPYSYCNNSPINAVDPDGNLTVF
ncbi:MAG: RHS repeat-associated core domain-containing protein, partial [Lachnospiraceae bacterium]|nr:RHS repeat-associated core domain-containing protein [Lachnospiraceae bacterium]